MNLHTQKSTSQIKRVCILVIRHISYYTFKINLVEIIKLIVLLYSLKKCII